MKRRRKQLVCILWQKWQRASQAAKSRSGVMPTTRLLSLGGKPRWKIFSVQPHWKTISVQSFSVHSRNLEAVLLLRYPPRASRRCVGHCRVASFRRRRRTCRRRRVPVRRGRSLIQQTHLRLRRFHRLQLKLQHQGACVLNAHLRLLLKAHLTGPAWNRLGRGRRQHRVRQLV